MNDAEDVVTSADEMTQEDVDEYVTEIVDAINRPRQGSFDGDDGGYLPPLDLPGFGTEYPDCGDKITHFCPDCGHQVEIGRTCKRSVCPRCAARWVIDPAVQMVAKSQAAAALMSARLGGVSVKQHHVIISPPEDWFLQANDPLDRTFEVIKEILDALGAEGSVQYHGWSGNDKQEDDRGKWKERLFNDRTWQDVRAELMPRPHFHAILNCPFIPGQSVTDRIYAATGWVIHRVADSDGKSLPTTERVAKGSTYTLSHTSIDTRGDGSNKAQYRKFGSTWHDAEVKEYRRRRAEHDVRKVAPKVLGISAKKIRCEASVEEASGDDLIDEYNASDAATDDTTGEGVDDAPADDTATDETADDTHDDTAEGSELEKCKGALIPISEADNYLNDDDWVDRCPYSEQLRRAYQDFQDQAQLDNPPPMIAAFS